MARHWQYLTACLAVATSAVGASNRTVPFQVIGAGLGRTGTSSMHKALDILGISPVHDYPDSQTWTPQNHMWAEQILLKKQGKYDTWQGIWDKAEQWDQILGNWSAIVDSPGNWFVAELSRAYPDAKVVLMVRDSPEVWLESWNNSITETHRIAASSWRWSFMRFLKRHWPLKNLYSLTDVRFHNPVRLALHTGDDSPEMEPQLSWYTGHLEHVRKYVPADRLLEFNVKQGWGPLCKFLNKPVPDVPFPHVNDRKRFLERIDGWKRASERTFNQYCAALVTILAVTVAYVYYPRLAKKDGAGVKSSE